MAGNTKSQTLGGALDAVYAVAKSKVQEDEKPAVRSFMSTGSFLDDLAISNGRGWPGGRIIEIYGPEGGGKTGKALMAGRQAQSAGGTCVYLDVERGLDPDYARNIMRVKLEKPYFYYHRPESMEHTLEKIEQTVEVACKFDSPTVIVVDSVAALCPQRTTRKKMKSMVKGVRKIGEEAQIMSWFFKRGFLDTIMGTNIYMIFINQVRSNIPTNKFLARTMAPTTTPAGAALRYYACLRVEVRQDSIISDEGRNSIGNMQSVAVIKNKVGPNHRETEYPWYFKFGPDNNISMLHYLRERGVLQHHHRGNYKIEGFDFKGPQLGDGSWHEKMAKDRKFRTHVAKVVMRHYLDEWSVDDIIIPKS